MATNNNICQKPAVNDIGHASFKQQSTPAIAQPNTSKPPPASEVPAPAPIAQPSPAHPPVPDGPVSGPSLGPTASPPPTVSGLPEEFGPGSPYMSTRTAIRNLTLPTVPNFDIPPSPPGSPPPRSTAKFTQFLELKKKGQHFNERLENLPALKDPGHLQKLMKFARMTYPEDGYASTLPEGIAVPTQWPQGVYAEELRESQKKTGQRREEENKKNPRDGIAFVSAGVSSGTSTPSGKASGQSASARVMSGLDRQAAGKRKELEQRGGRSESNSRWDREERSPKRKREADGERR